MFKDNSVRLTQGKTNRNELPLPQLHFIACDDWMKKIGNTAFCAWLTLWTMADRRDKEREFDRVPETMSDLAEKLGISKPTLYKNVVRPLWDYGFIDLVEFDLPVKGSKENPVNIIVYRYPQNKYELSTKPLEKIRDYEADYKKREREYKSFIGKKGANKKESQLKNLTGENEGSQLKNLTGSQLKNLTGSQLKNLTNQYIFKNNKNIIHDNNNQEREDTKKASNNDNEKNVVDDCPIKLFLEAKSLKIGKSSLGKLKTLANQETIIKALKVAIVKAKNNPIGYALKMLKEGFDGSEYVSAKPKDSLPEYVEKQGRKSVSKGAPSELDEEQKRQAQELLRALGEI